MLQIKNINVFYGMVQVLYDVSISVDEGQLVALVGANGAGKTTTLSTISGLLKPKSGEIIFMDKPIHRLPAHSIVDEGLIMVPEGRRLFAKMTVSENLEMGSFPRRCHRFMAENMKKVYEMFPILEERRTQLAGTLSGGEQQMLAIGRALMTEPKILLLDEPSQGLAPLIVQSLFLTVEKICREQKITVLLVEQNVKHALSIADKGFVLENGAVVMEGTGKELLQNEDLKRAYLGI